MLQINIFSIKKEVYIVIVLKTYFAECPSTFLKKQTKLKIQTAPRYMVLKQTRIIITQIEKTYVKNNH